MPVPIVKFLEMVDVQQRVSNHEYVRILSRAAEEHSASLGWGLEAYRRLADVTTAAQVDDLRAGALIERELMLVRVRAEGEAIVRLMQLVEIFRATVVGLALRITRSACFPTEMEPLRSSSKSTWGSRSLKRDTRS